MDQFLQQLINGVTLGSLYALIAVGYTVVYGIIQLINFAHGEIFMVGAFGGLSTHLLFFKNTTALWTLPFVLLGAVICSVVVAVLMERFAYRPLRNAPRLAPLITAIGVSVFLQEVVRLFYNRIPGANFPDAKSQVTFPGIDGVSNGSINIGNISIPYATVFTVGALAVCSVFLYVFVNRTRTGRAMKAVATDPDTARLMGINVDRIIVTAFVLGAVLAAIAGVASGLQINTIYYRMGFSAGLKAFTAAVLGGIGNIWGAVVGGLLIGLLEAMCAQYMIGKNTWASVWLFVVLILVLVFRPQGLLGARVVDRA